MQNSINLFWPPGARGRLQCYAASCYRQPIGSSSPSPRRPGFTAGGSDLKGSGKGAYGHFQCSEQTRKDQSTRVVTQTRRVVTQARGSATVGAMRRDASFCTHWRMTTDNAQPQGHSPSCDKCYGLAPDPMFFALRTSGVTIS